MDPARASFSEYGASAVVTRPLMRQIVKQIRKAPAASKIRSMQLNSRREKDKSLSEKKEEVKNSLPPGTVRLAR